MIVLLRSLTDDTVPEESASIDREELSDADQPLVAPGAVFYWSIVYRVESHGQKRLVSDFRFRRLPSWTLSEIERARAEAAKFDEIFE